MQHSGSAKRHMRNFAGHLSNMLLVSSLKCRPESLLVHPRVQAGLIQATYAGGPLLLFCLGGRSVFVCLFRNAALCVWLDQAIRCGSALMQTDSTESTELE